MKVISKNNRDAARQGICEAIKFDQSLIAGTDCLDETCDGFCKNCSRCPHNTKTPYVIINGHKHYLADTGDYYIIVFPDGGIGTTNNLTAFYRIISE